MAIPPGIVYLGQRLPRIITPPALVYLVLYGLRTCLQVIVSPYLAFVAYALCWPTALAIQVQYINLLDYRAAQAHGAIMPPRIPDRTPGGAATLFKSIQNFKKAYPGDGLIDQIEKLGHVLTLRVLFENRIFTDEPGHIKSILTTQFEEHEKGEEMRQVFHSLLGTGVFASDGDMWKFHRSMSRPFFSKDRVQHFDVFDRHAEDALGQMKARLKQGFPVDFQDLVSRFTLDSATEFLCGQDIRSLSAGLPYPRDSPEQRQSSSEQHPSDRFATAFAQAQVNTALRSRYGQYWPLFEFWEDKVEGHMKIVHEFIEPILHEAVKQKQAVAPEDSKEPDTLLEHLVNSTEDHIILRDEVMSLMAAGRDTTASTLTFAAYMLAEHPHVLQKLRDEILSKVGPDRRPSYDDFREMKYLRAVINETLRLFSVVPFNSRITKHATIWNPVVPGDKPIYIPAKTKTIFGVFLMHRRTDLWGPDALEFDPERFIDERLHKYLTPNPFIFLPFNAGPRICLGQQFAYHEVSFFLVRLLQSFSGIQLAPDAQPSETLPPNDWAKAAGRKSVEKISPKVHLTLYSNGGLWVRMEEAGLSEAA
ncbi:cytochrome P450 [Pluteus cervinus]|uniref:Cytochrome P450 n=1 Tax=Pluteus cervinus TaxID=181527 RepID=A0ACD3AG36_9AGAR|nr:cytochrome P450 [Pluteus cervinus]